MYDICSVVDHIGESENDGSYICYARGLDGSDWTSYRRGMECGASEKEATGRPYFALYEKRTPFCDAVREGSRIARAPIDALGLGKRVSAFGEATTANDRPERRRIMGECIARVRGAGGRARLPPEIQSCANRELAPPPDPAADLVGLKPDAIDESRLDDTNPNDIPAIRISTPPNACDVPEYTEQETHQ